MNRVIVGFGLNMASYSLRLASIVPLPPNSPLWYAQQHLEPFQNAVDTAKDTFDIYDQTRSAIEAEADLTAQLLERLLKEQRLEKELEEERERARIKEEELAAELEAQRAMEEVALEELRLQLEAEAELAGLLVAEEGAAQAELELAETRSSVRGGAGGSGSET
jgi:hypothetical protein